MSGDLAAGPIDGSVGVRSMRPEDLDAADRVLRLAFGTIRGLPDPASAFEDADLVHTRFRAAPECAWAAELDGELVGSVFAARWGSFAFFGPLTVHPELWGRGIGSRLLEPVLAAFGQWDVRQAGLFTFPDSAKHLGLYQKHGFWPGRLTAVTARAVPQRGRAGYARLSRDPGEPLEAVLDEIRGLTDEVFAGLDLSREILAVHAQELGDTILLREGTRLEGMAVCHCGAATEAGSGTCYVKFAAARPGSGAVERFERLLDACEAFAAEAGAERVVAGVNTGRLDAYRRLLARGYRTQRIGVSMRLRPGEPFLDAPTDYVIDDLR
jgi:GNAT superfamily N-acetyltransferase